MRDSRSRIRRRNRAIKKRNRQRLVLFSISLVLFLGLSFKFIKSVSLFKKNNNSIAKVNTDLGGDSEKVNALSTKEKLDQSDVEAITKRLNNDKEDISDVLEMTKDLSVDEESFSNKLQEIVKAKELATIYKTPSTKSDVITEVPLGAYLESYGSSEGFTKVTYNNQSGYISADLLEKILDENTFKVVDGILIVNRKYNLPKDYNPGVNLEAMQSYEMMKSEMNREGLDLKIISDFRSFEEQKRVYDSQLESIGEEETRKVTADPGHSEHQTGYAFDFWLNNDDITITDAFDDTKEAEWLKNNAYKYGFILRYPRGKEDVTGYSFESWHYRYVGAETAKKIFDSGLTVEEFYGL